MSDEAIRLFQMLIQAGAQPGEDFSYDLQTASAQISDSAFEKLKATFPDIDWDSLSERVEVDPQQAVDAINQFLEIDFVERILTRVESRLATLEASQAAWYLQQVLGGVEQRTRVPIYGLLQRRLPIERQVLLEQLLRHRATPCYVWMLDLIDAAGGDISEIEMEEDEATLTEQNLALLTAVWDGEYDLIEAPELPSSEPSSSEPSSSEPSSSEQPALEDATGQSTADPGISAELDPPAETDDTDSKTD